MQKENICVVCGRGKQETEICSFKGEKYCKRHYLQMYRYGKIYERTIYDLNEYIIEEDIAYIILYDKYGNVTGKTMIDSKNVEKCKQIKWYKRTNRNGSEYVRGSLKGYGKNGEKVFLHKFILDYDGSSPIDHINNDGLDNRECNLRICTKQENSMNNHKDYKIVGVNFYKANQKYSARIMVNYKGIHLGYYENIEDAIKARREAEIKYFGEFAPCLNEEIIKNNQQQYGERNNG